MLHHLCSPVGLTSNSSTHSGRVYWDSAHCRTARVAAPAPARPALMGALSCDGPKGLSHVSYSSIHRMLWYARYTTITINEK